MEGEKEKKQVAEILSGNERTLRTFYKQYARPLTSFVGKRVDMKEDVEEIVQDAFFAFLEALRDFSFKSSLFTFLCAIANHKIIDYYRKRKIKSVLFSKISDVEPFLSNLIGPEQRFDEVLVARKIKETFTKLPSRQRLILSLKYIYGYSVAEIAHKLAISFKSAESSLFRARKAFVAIYSL